VEEFRNVPVAFAAVYLVDKRSEICNQYRWVSLQAVGRRILTPSEWFCIQYRKRFEIDSSSNFGFRNLQIPAHARETPVACIPRRCLVVPIGPHGAECFGTDKARVVLRRLLLSKDVDADVHILTCGSLNAGTYGTSAQRKVCLGHLRYDADL